MDGRFLTAFILPKEWDIMGYKLKPFSLRHTLVLMALQSPVLAMQAGRIKPEDIIIFLRICSTDNAFVALKEPTWRDKLNQVRLEISIKKFVEVAVQIKAYMVACNTTPVTYSKDDEKEKTKENIPGVLGMATSLMSRLHMSPEEAWNCTVGQAVWYVTAYGVSEGADIKILSTEDESKAPDERELLVKMQAEALAKVKERMSKIRGGES